MSSIGIDFEYANGHRGSICRYGLAFEDGSQEEGFVRLHSSSPLQERTGFHGITQEETDGGIGFGELYERIRSLATAEGTLLVAHDLKSDRRAWHAAQLQHGLEPLPLSWVDSLPLAQREISRSKIPGKSGIAAMALRYGLTIDHHQPADDASVALEIFRRNSAGKFIIVKDLRSARRVQARNS